MITNERQYRITKAQLSRLKQAAEAFDVAVAAKRSGSRVLAKAELEALKSEVDVLSTQLQEYEALKSGAVTVLTADSLDELPGILIRARIARGLSQRQLAEALGIKEQQIQRYESEEYAAASLRKLKDVAEALNLNIRKVAEFRPDFSIQTTTHKKDIAWERFPFKEMYRRNWFEEIGFTGSIKAAIASQKELVEAFVQNAMPRRQPALLTRRVRYEKEMDEYGLLAWQCRILLLAEHQTRLGSYSRAAITDNWLCALAQESRFDNGPLRAREKLAQAGIPLIIEPHLPETYLDGAAFLLPNSNPVIGMSLRYDRLDNFWFVLFHELIHIIKHLRVGEVEQIFDIIKPDETVVLDKLDELEREADNLAGQALIPDENWETALARYLRSKESIQALAEEIRIHPAIIAGRIRKEAENYRILMDLVGQGEVRKHFPEARFGM